MPCSLQNQPATHHWKLKPLTLPVLDLGLFFSASNTEPIIVDRGDLFWYLRASAAFFTDEPQGVVWSESFVYEITSKYYTDGQCLHCMRRQRKFPP